MIATTRVRRRSLCVVLCVVVEGGSKDSGMTERSRLLAFLLSSAQPPVHPPLPHPTPACPLVLEGKEACQGGHEEDERVKARFEREVERWERQEAGKQDEG